MDWRWSYRARFARATAEEFVSVLVERAVRASVRNFLGGLPDLSATGVSSWAKKTARRLLAKQLLRRWSHTLGVARRAEEVAWVLPVEEQDLLIAAVWLHDIGNAAEFDVEEIAGQHAGRLSTEELSPGGVGVADRRGRCPQTPEHTTNGRGGDLREIVAAQQHSAGFWHPQELRRCHGL